MTDETPPGAPPVALFEFFNEIGIIEQLARNRLERALPDGMRVSHFSLLNHLVRLGDGKSPLQLARAFQVAKGAITNTLQKLEAKGFIRLIPDPDDGRAKKVLLTERGRRMRDEAIEAMTPVLAAAEKDLGRAAFTDTLPSLRIIRAWLDERPDRNE
jgi:DNA-binding MarR family transcriptional regulator